MSWRRRWNRYWLHVWFSLSMEFWWASNENECRRRGCLRFNHALRRRVKPLLFIPIVAVHMQMLSIVMCLPSSLLTEHRLCRTYVSIIGNMGSVRSTGLLPESKVPFFLFSSFRSSSFFPPAVLCFCLEVDPQNAMARSTPGSMCPGLECACIPSAPLPRCTWYWYVNVYFSSVCCADGGRYTRTHTDR